MINRILEWMVEKINWINGRIHYEAANIIIKRQEKAERKAAKRMERLLKNGKKQ